MSRETRVNTGVPAPVTTGDTKIPSAHDESGLARWSRRKAAAQQGSSDRVDDLPGESAQVTENIDKPDDKPIEHLTDQDMPPLESLDEHSDYSGFLSPAVSEKLRKQALRKLFHLDLYNVTDGLDDYAEDYTQFAKLGNIITADMRLQQLRAERAAEAESTTIETGAKENDEPGTGPNNITEPVNMAGDDDTGHESREESENFEDSENRSQS